MRRFTVCKYILMFMFHQTYQMKTTLGRNRTRVNYCSPDLINKAALHEQMINSFHMANTKKIIHVDIIPIFLKFSLMKILMISFQANNLIVGIRLIFNVI